MPSFDSFKEEVGMLLSVQEVHEEALFFRCKIHTDEVCASILLVRRKTEEELMAEIDDDKEIEEEEVKNSDDSEETAMKIKSYMNELNGHHLSGETSHLRNWKPRLYLYIFRDIQNMAFLQKLYS